MSFDTVVANAGRLRILAALSAQGAQEFVQLRRSTALTDGNLSAHARRLQTAGLIDIEKAFKGGKPVTTFLLNATGRQRLADHVRALVDAVTPSTATDLADHTPPRELSHASAPASDVHAFEPADDWVD